MHDETLSISLRIAANCELSECLVLIADALPRGLQSVAPPPDVTNSALLFVHLRRHHNHKGIRIGLERPADEISRFDTPTPKLLGKSRRRVNAICFFANVIDVAERHENACAFHES
jgi:hypothetical protein